MLDVRNVVCACDDGGYKTETHKGMLIVHRISFAKDEVPRHEVEPIPDCELTGPLLADRFRDRMPRRPGSYTGGKVPYHLLIRENGGCDQLLPLNYVAPHARRWSRHSVSLAIAGDLRGHEPTHLQWHNAMQLGTVFTALGWPLYGHDEPEGAAGPGKQCPGKFWRMSDFRDECFDAAGHSCMTYDEARQILDMIGLQW